MKYGFVRVAAAIPIVKVADCKFNAQQIETQIAIADGKGVQIIIFPELSITGYTCADLFGQSLLLEEAEHAAKFAELLGDCVWDTKTNLEKRMNAESGACADKKRIATRAKALNLDAIHDTVHEMAKDEARHGKGFEGLYNRYFKK